MSASYQDFLFGEWPVVALQAFFDDSNHHGPSDDAGRPGILIYGGYLSDQASWKRFDLEWNACLSDDPPIRYFKMSEAMSGEGEFSQLDEPLRHYKINQFYKIISRHILVSTFCGVILSDYQDVMNEKNGVPPQFTNPHFFIYYGIVQNIGLGLKLIRKTGPVSFIFDEGNPMKAQIFAAWASFSEHGPVPAGVLSGSPIFADDKQSPPLQAADYFAWICRSKIGHQLAGKSEPRFPWEKGLSPKMIRPTPLLWNKAALLSYREIVVARQSTL
jgi:hypothetical protein